MMTLSIILIGMALVCFVASLVFFIQLGRVVDDLEDMANQMKKDMAKRRQT